MAIRMDVNDKARTCIYMHMYYNYICTCKLIRIQMIMNYLNHK